MKQTILISNTLGCDIRSRSNVERMKDSLSDTNSYIFDMQNVSFISRSVADELCNLAEIFSIIFINTSDMVNNMLQVVSANRNKNHRKRISKDAQIIECRDFKSLSDVLVQFS